jgi:hypothetical protein
MPQDKTGSLPEKTDKNGGLSLASLEDILSDLRFQPEWRAEADRCDDYFDGHQLTTDRLAVMERLGIPPLVTNLIAPVVNSILGQEAKSRTDWRVVELDEADEVPEDVMNALNAKVNKVERDSGADRAISEAYASMIKSGVGWVEVSRATDANAYPYRICSVPRNEMWWDMRSRENDLSDARYLVRKRRYDVDELIAMIPEHRELIDWATNDRFKTWQSATVDQLGATNLAYAAHLERITKIEETDWRDAERKRATIYEVWYRHWQRGDVFALPDGRIIPVDKKNQKHVMAIQSGVIKPEKRVYSAIRVAFYMGCHRLYDFASPYSHRFFPYVPFFGYREAMTGIYYGVVRNMISPQDVVNSSDAKMHWMLSARRMVADADALDTRYNTLRQVQEQLSSPNAVVILDPTKPNSRFKIESDFQLSAQQFSRRMQAAADIEAAGGVFKAAMGKESAATSGIAINSLVEQNGVGMAEINDNASFARKQVGELTFSLILEDMKGKETPVATKENGKRKIFILNQKQVDPATGEETLVNGTANIKAKVTLADIKSTASYKAQQLSVLSEVAKSLPPEMQAVLVPGIIELTDIDDRDFYAEEIRRMTGTGKKLSEEEQTAKDQQDQQAQAEAGNMQKRIEELNVRMLEQKVAEIEGKNAKQDAEKISKMVEAIYAAMQAGAVIASNPGVAPIADGLLAEAGFNSYRPENMPAVQPEQPPPPMPQEQEMLLPPSPDMPVNGEPTMESPFSGEREGIETMETENLVEP